MLFSTSALTFQERRQTVDQSWEQYWPFCTSRLCQAKSEGIRVSQGFELEIPAGQISVIYSTCRSYPTAFLTKHKGKKKKERKEKPTKWNQNKNLSPSVIRIARRLAFSYKLVLSKADWERWMELFRTEITRAELSLPPLFPSCGNSNLSTYIKGTDLTCRVCLGHWGRRRPSHPKSFWTA